MILEPVPHAWLVDLRATSSYEQLESFEAPSGTLVFAEGEPGDSFIIVTDGQVTVLRNGEEIATMGVGSVLGELALLTGDLRATTVVAATGIHGLRGNAEDFQQLLECDSIRTHFMELATQRLAANAEPVPLHTAEFHGLVRPLLPTDRDMYIDALARLSPQSRRLRFFTPAPPSDKLIDYLLAIDYINHFAWVVLDGDQLHPGVAVGRFIRDRDDLRRAEVAFAVVDAQQGRGLATVLLGALGVAADASGIETFTAEVLEDNAPMRHVFDKAGARWHRADRGVVGATMLVADVRQTVADELQLALEKTVAALSACALTALKI